MTKMSNTGLIFSLLRNSLLINAKIGVARRQNKPDEILTLKLQKTMYKYERTKTAQPPTNITCPITCMANILINYMGKRRLMQIRDSSCEGNI